MPVGDVMPSQERADQRQLNPAVLQVRSQAGCRCSVPSCTPLCFFVGQGELNDSEAKARTPWSVDSSATGRCSNACVKM